MRKFVLSFIAIVFVFILCIWGLYAFLIIKGIKLAPKVYNDMIKKDTSYIMTISPNGDTLKTITIN